MAVSWSLLYIISEWLIRLILVPVVVRRGRAPSGAMAWLIVIFLIPWVGLALYLLFGENRLPRRRIQTRRIRHQQTQDLTQAGRQAPHVVHPRLDPEQMPIVSLAERLGEMPILGGNAARLMIDTDEVIDRLIEDIEQARHHVHLQFYIMFDDATGRRTAEALIAAARRGVVCRVLLDAVGSWRAFKRLVPELRRGGVQVFSMLPVNPFRRKLGRMDLRNHRKIAVIDGQVGYTGSQNIVDASYGHKHLQWYDIMLRLSGPIVLQLQGVFVEDWFQETDERIEQADYFPPQEHRGELIVQSLPSGPTFSTENYQRLVVAALYGAKQEVIITSPYLVPDEAFLQAMQVCTLRGVRVSLIVPRRGDQWLPDLAGRAYFDDLLAMGVRVYRHQQGLLHAKTMTIDDAFALTGSGNFDIRSFYLNFELSLLFYGPGPARRLREIQHTFLEQSSLLTAEQWNGRPLWIRPLEGLAKLLSPLL